MVEVLRFGKVIGKILAFRSDPERTKAAAVSKYGKGVTLVNV